MIRWSLFLTLAAGLVAYSFWVYLRVELGVPWARRLAAARAIALVVLLALLFDARLPEAGSGPSDQRWVLLDASLSMGAVPSEGRSAWDEASARALQLERDGWRVVTFGAGAELGGLDAEMSPAADMSSAAGTSPAAGTSQLAPVLERAAESGVRSVRVLSDLRLEDQVAVRAALSELPLEVAFERFGEGIVNAGISGLYVPDQVRPEGSFTAEVEVHSTGGDSLVVRVFEEDVPVAETAVAAPSPGLRSRVPLELPAPLGTGRVRYTASVEMDGDGFPSDDIAVRYANVGTEEGALVLLSLRPDWEPRYLLPVLGNVTGLPSVGYLRVGPDAFVRMGRALDRGAPLDSAYVGRAAAEAAILVLHGLDAGTDGWARALVGRPGRTILIPSDAEGAGLVDIPSDVARGGEWYASTDVPASPIAGALAGLPFQELPPLSSVLLPSDPTRVRGALLVQLRGAGSPEAALHLEEREDGRVAVVLATGFWRWAAREDGREAYRRMWSGIAGWLLEDQTVTTPELRPTNWVVERGDPVTWSAPGDSVEARLLVSAADSGGDVGSDSVFVDTVVTGGRVFSTGVLPPGAYRYRVERPNGEVTTDGRFDVTGATSEMLPAPTEPSAADDTVSGAMAAVERPGRPLRTEPWPYLLVIGLLCGEWIGRRRIGLR